MLSFICLIVICLAVCWKKSGPKSAETSEPEHYYETAEEVVDSHFIMTSSIPYAVNKIEERQTSCNLTAEESPNVTREGAYDYITPNSANNSADNITTDQDPDSAIYSYITDNHVKTSASNRAGKTPGTMTMNRAYNLRASFSAKLAERRACS